MYRDIVGDPRGVLASSWQGLVARIRGTPGRRRADSERQPTAIHRLGTGAYQGIGTPISAPSVRVRLHDPAAITPGHFAYLADAAKLTQPEALTLLNRVGLASLALLAGEFAEQFEPLVAPVGSTVDYDLGVRFYVRKGSSGTGEAGIMRAFAVAQRDMLFGDEFGWVTDVRGGLLMTAVSQPLPHLLLLPPEALDHKPLLGDPLVSRLLELLDNPAEWLLVMGMFISALMAAWEAAGQHDLLACGLSLLQRIREYVAAHLADVERQISTVPSVSMNAVSQERLWQCIPAALGAAEWPPYEFHQWNRIRIRLRQHPLLPSKHMARFVKKARPIGDPFDPVGFEVTFEPEDDDVTAQNLMRAIRAELKRRQ